MARLRRWLILAHRYLGIVLSLVFLSWFVSGIAMIYARGMPSLTPDVRMQRLPLLDLQRVRLDPADAAAIAGLSESAARPTLLTILDRPAYRFAAATPVTVFADTGERLEVGDVESLAIAARFANLPQSALRHAGTLEHPDQWTIGEQRLMPLHRIVVADAERTELYVSERSGEVAVLTTRGSRALAWVAAIPHWFYFAPLRLNNQLWRQAVLWASGLGAFTVLVGLVLVVTQYRTRYVGWMRWHYVTGVVFGVVTLTFVLSGFLSMDPWNWAGGGGSGAGIPQALSGGALDLSDVPVASVLSGVDGPTVARAVKEVDFRRIQGAPYYVLRGSNPDPILLGAASMQIRSEPFSLDSILQRIRDGNAGVQILDVQMLSDYDHYYYDRDRGAPLPILRVTFDDPDRTRVYIDPVMNQLVARFTRLQRVERWLYHGLHSLDFPFWYYNRGWEAGVIALCAGGAMLSFIGVVIGFRRVWRVWCNIA